MKFTQLPLIMNNIGLFVLFLNRLQLLSSTCSITIDTNVFLCLRPSSVATYWPHLVLLSSTMGPLPRHLSLVLPSQVPSLELPMVGSRQLGRPRRWPQGHALVPSPP